MPRYCTRARKTRALWVEDEVDNYSNRDNIDVPDHEPTPTGILDVNGDMICRLPPPMGFQFWGDD